MRCLVEGLGWAQQARRGRRSWPWWHVPGASALAEARARLGPEPLRVLFERAAQPLATQATRGAWYRGWRLLILDGTCLDVPDSPANQVFGRSKSGRGEGVGAFPQVRVVGWWRPERTRSWRPPRGPVRPGSRPSPPACPRSWSAGAGVLVLADRLLVGAGLWQAMAATGAELVWRVKCATKNAPRWGSTGCWGRLLAEPQLRPQRPPQAPPPDHGAGHRIHPGRPRPAYQHRPLPAGDHHP